MRKIGGFSHCLEALEFASQQSETALSWFDGLGRLEHERSYAQLLGDTKRFAHWLQQQLPAQDWAASGAQWGPRIGIIAATGPEFLPAFCACQSIGAIPCPLPVLGPLQDMARYSQTVHKMCLAADIRCIIGPKQLLQSLQESSAETAHAFETLAFEDLHAIPGRDDNAAAPISHRHIDPAAIAYVQFSSGSTGHPKGIAISHAALMHNIDAMLEPGMGLQPADRAFSWLPYFHDMGLVGFVLAPLCAQVSVDYWAPSSFARRPHLWLDLMAKRGTSITYAPNFAWALAVKAAPQLPHDSTLYALRIAGVGGDYIDYPGLQAFAQCFAKHGFEANAFKPSYGLAEATLAVTLCQLPFEQQFSHCVIEADTGLVRAAQPNETNAKSMVNCGQPLPGWRVQIRDETGQILSAARQGHIYLQGPAQMSGYFEDGNLHPIAANQWIETGDQGFLTQEGALFISGRSKDVIIIHGRNVWPLDIESAVYETTGIALEHQIFLQLAHDSDQTPQWHLLVHEKAVPQSEQSTLLAKMAAVATTAAGVSVNARLIPNGSIKYTSSGKKARALSQSRIIDWLTNAAIAPSPLHHL